MFRGVNHINMDSKFRIAMPTKYREALLEESAGRMVVNIDLNQPECLALYPANIWDEIEERIQSQLRNVGEEARIRRLLLGHASDIEMDASGRLLLPAALREHARLDKKVTLIGMGKKLELWREDKWEAEKAAGFKEATDPVLVEKLIGNIGYI